MSCFDNCCCLQESEEGQERQATLRFLRKELLYDIRNYAYIEGHVMDQERQHAQHTLVDIGEYGNIDRVSRILAVVFSAAVEMLYPYTKEEPAEGEEVDDKQWDPDEYVIHMQVPTTFSKTSLHLLSKLIHEFMVYRVLYDWLGITNPEAAQKWLDKAKEAEEEVNTLKHTRRGVLRRPPHPF